MEKGLMITSAVEGDYVVGAVGTKGGWGRVLRVERGGYTVEFPKRNYPETMVVPTGCYFIPFERTYEVRPGDMGPPDGYTPTGGTE
jgi:hypothetical protein